MTEIPFYQVDAFTSRPFAGNPAAVCPLEAWLPDEVLLAIAAENNLSETAFFVQQGDRLELRWFTPAVEVDLCGHATLAAGFVVLTRLAPGRAEVTFETRSGPLTVRREGDGLALDLPARPAAPAEVGEDLVAALGARPKAAIRARDLVAIFERAEEVRALRPDMSRLSALDVFAVGVTAPGGGGEDADVDFVSRFFAPAKGVPEDPVTGSLHCTLVPYWAERLGKTALAARQVSRRGGELRCALAGDRVLLGGQAALVIEGTLRF